MSNQIKLLTIKGCHNCETAKQTLEKHGLIFDVIDCDEHPEEIPDSIKNENLTLPFLKIQDNCFLIGSNQDYLKEIIEKLLGLATKFPS
jgi:glutaredoxin